MTDNLVDVIATGDVRKSLVAIRDYLAHELEGNRCDRCAMSQLKTGDTAALVLRLTKVMEEIQALPEPAVDGEVRPLDELRARRDRPAATGDLPPSDVKGSRAAPRRQGGRRPRVNRT